MQGKPKKEVILTEEMKDILIQDVRTLKFPKRTSRFIFEGRFAHLENKNYTRGLNMKLSSSIFALVTSSLFEKRHLRNCGPDTLLKVMDTIEPMGLTLSMNFNEEQTQQILKGIEKRPDGLFFY